MHAGDLMDINKRVYREGFHTGDDLNQDSKIDHVEAATPRTISRYTLHEKGASFGTKFEGLDISMNMHKHLPGLFHAGSVGIIMSGWLGAANYGVIQSHNVDNYLDQMNRA